MRCCARNKEAKTQRSLPLSEGETLKIMNIHKVYVLKWCFNTHSSERARGCRRSWLAKGCGTAPARDHKHGTTQRDILALLSTEKRLTQRRLSIKIRGKHLSLLTELGKSVMFSGSLEMPITSKSNYLDQ